MPPPLFGTQYLLTKYKEIYNNMFEAILQSARATKITKVADLTDGYTSAKPFSIFVCPTDNSPKEAGEVLVINAKPVDNAAAVDVPVVIGDWSPVVFDAIGTGGINTSSYDVYIAEIKVS